MIGIGLTQPFSVRHVILTPTPYNHVTINVAEWNPRIIITIKIECPASW